MDSFARSCRRSELLLAACCLCLTLPSPLPTFSHSASPPISPISPCSCPFSPSQTANHQPEHRIMGASSSFPQFLSLFFPLSNPQPPTYPTYYQPVPQPTLPFPLSSQLVFLHFPPSLPTQVLRRIFVSLYCQTFVIDCDS